MTPSGDMPDPVAQQESFSLTNVVPQSGQYGPMHTRVISATAGEAPYMPDGLHPQAHRTSLRIAEHYTDTAGATDHLPWRGAGIVH